MGSERRKVIVTPINSLTIEQLIELLKKMHNGNYTTFDISNAGKMVTRLQKVLATLK